MKLAFSLLFISMGLASVWGCKTTDEVGGDSTVKSPSSFIVRDTTIPHYQVEEKLYRGKSPDSAFLSACSLNILSITKSVDDTGKEDGFLKLRASASISGAVVGSSHSQVFELTSNLGYLPDANAPGGGRHVKDPFIYAGRSPTEAASSNKLVSLAIFFSKNAQGVAVPTSYRYLDQSGIVSQIFPQQINCDHLQ